MVGATHDPVYWLHLQAPAVVTFAALDQGLRNIWLKCCGHLSAFRFPRNRVRSTSPLDFARMLLPLLNSPRTGVCGYCGPSVEPPGVSD